MECGAANFAARAGTTVFLSYFKHPPDRRQLGKVVYPLEEILLFRLLAVLARRGKLRRHRPGSARRSATSCAGPEPVEGRLFRAARRHAIRLASPSSTSRALQRCFVARVAAPTKTPAEFVAIVLRFRSG